MRQTLRYDPSLSRECTWRIKDGLDGIEARVRIASAAEVLIEPELRWMRTHAQAPLAVHCRQLDEGTWLTESANFHPDLPRLELLLADVPEHAGEALRLL